MELIKALLLIDDMKSRRIQFTLYSVLSGTSVELVCNSIKLSFVAVAFHSYICCGIPQFSRFSYFLLESVNTHDVINVTEGMKQII